MAYISASLTYTDASMSDIGASMAYIGASMTYMGASVAYSGASMAHIGYCLVFFGAAVAYIGSSNAYSDYWCFYNIYSRRDMKQFQGVSEEHTHYHLIKHCKVKTPKLDVAHLLMPPSRFKIPISPKKSPAPILFSITPDSLFVK